MNITLSREHAVLEEFEGVFRLRFSRGLEQPPEVVWRAITEPALLHHWFPQQVEYLSWDGEPAAGCGIRFTMPAGAARHGADGATFDGEVLLCEAPAAFRFRWGPDLLRFGLEPDGDGTALTFVVALDHLDKAARDAAGWHVCLDALEALLDGDALVAGLDRDPDAEGSVRPGMTPAQRRAWTARFAQYAGLFGDEASGDRVSAG